MPYIEYMIIDKEEYRIMCVEKFKNKVQELGDGDMVDNLF